MDGSLKSNDSSGTASSRSMNRLVRPLTRGELRDRLQAGETCEVAAHVAEMTAIVLTGWLQFDQFNVDPSENEGWVLFVPNDKVRDAG
jgi:hypothetical protein